MKLRMLVPLLLSGGQGVSYAVRDGFNTDLATGAVDGTNSEPGPGVREIVDTGGNISISSGKLVVTGGTGTWAQTGWYLTPSVARAAGKTIIMDIRSSSFNTMMFGLTTAADANFTGFANVGIEVVNTPIFRARRISSPTSVAFFTPVADTDYVMAMVLRNAGRFIFLKVAGIWKLMWLDNWDNTATLYLAASHNNLAAQMSYDNVRLPESVYDIQVLASDSFDRANGALGNTDGAGHAEASSGSGEAWTNDVGTTEIATNVAAASALSGGIAIATVDVANADVLVMANLTRSAGNVGVVTRYVDANNYIYTYHDGTNVVTVKVVAGTPTTVHTTTATYSASARLMVIADGTAFRICYNDLLVTTATISDAALQAGTKHGLYSSNTGNTHNNFVVYARNGYADLDEV